MTEEIIIGGVDVAGCNAYKEGHCLDKTAILLCDTNKCSNYNDCYYKQLKRLEQERGELKKELGTNEIQLANAEFDLHFEETKAQDLVRQIDELKAENERLKAELEPYKHPDVITLLTNWRTGELDRTHNKIANERDKYRQILQEIKEIVYEVCKICQDNVTSHCEQCFYNKILSKCNEISEVE